MAGDLHKSGFSLDKNSTWRIQIWSPDNSIMRRPDVGKISINKGVSWGDFVQDFLPRWILMLSPFTKIDFKTHWDSALIRRKS